MLAERLSPCTIPLHPPLLVGVDPIYENQHLIHLLRSLETYDETNILMGISCQGRWWQCHTESESSPGDGGKFAISSDSSIGFGTGVESYAGVWLRVQSVCCKILGRREDRFTLVSKKQKEDGLSLTVEGCR
jgi:hypothetical protein